MSVRNDSPRRFEVTAGNRKSVLPTELTPNHRRSVYARFMIHEWSIRKLAMADGTPEAVIEDALRQSVNEDRLEFGRKERVRGRLSVMPPITMLRRAA
jgi:hypothetical protein